MNNRKPRRVLRDVEKFEARRFREVGMSIKDCATYFDVSVATLMRGLADMRAKLGEEKVPPRRRQYARNPIAMSARSTQRHESN